MPRNPRPGWLSTSIGAEDRTDGASIIRKATPGPAGRRRSTDESMCWAMAGGMAKALDAISPRAHADLARGMAIALDAISPRTGPVEREVRAEAWATVGAGDDARGPGAWSDEERAAYVVGLGIAGLHGEVLRFLVDALRDTPLPLPWALGRNEAGRPHFSNGRTLVNSCHHPLECALRELADVCVVCLALPPDFRDSCVTMLQDRWQEEASGEYSKWYVGRHRSGRKFFFHRDTREAMWDHPAFALLPAYYMKIRAVEQLKDDRYLTGTLSSASSLQFSRTATTIPQYDGLMSTMQRTLASSPDLEDETRRWHGGSGRREETQLPHAEGQLDPPAWHERWGTFLGSRFAESQAGLCASLPSRSCHEAAGSGGADPEKPHSCRLRGCSDTRGDCGGDDGDADEQILEELLSEADSSREVTLEELLRAAAEVLEDDPCAAAKVNDRGGAGAGGAPAHPEDLGTTLAPPPARESVGSRLQPRCGGA